MLSLRKISYLLYVLLIAASCSTVKVIPQDQSRLKQNKIVIKNSTQYDTDELLPYIKQKPNTYFFLGWNPFINVYNWRNGKDNGWNRFLEKIGQAPVIFNNELVEQSNVNITNHLIYKGYYNSDVTADVNTKNKKTTVTYNVNLGNRYYIDSVVIRIEDTTLNRVFFDSNLDDIFTKGELLSEESLNNKSQLVTNELRNNGFFSFTKNYLFFEADTTNRNGNAILYVDVRNYTRNESPNEAKPHRIFTINDVNYTTNKKKKNNFEYIYQGDSVVAVPIINQEDSYDSMRVHSVNYYYKNKPLLKPKMLSRINYIKPGEIYSEQLIKQTYDRISNLKVFSSVNIQLDPVDSNTVDCNVNLTASDIQGFEVGLEASINSNSLLGISPKVSYFHKNLFRGAEIFSINLMGDFQFGFKNNKRATEFGVSTSLSLPTFIFLPDRIFKSHNIPRTEFVLSYNYQTRPEFSRFILSGSFNYNWSIKERFFIKITPIRANIVKIYNMDSIFFNKLKDPYIQNSYMNHFDFGLSANFFYTTDPAPTHKKNYFYARWNNRLSGNLLSLFNNCLPENELGMKTIWGSAYSQYYKTELTGVYTLFFGKKSNHSIALRGLVGVGYGYGNSLSLPFEELFWAGGANSLRAWAARSVGPGSLPMDEEFSIPNQMGDMRLEANIEYRFPIFWSFEGAVFVDCGNVWNVETFGDNPKEEGVFKFNTFYRELALGWGAGLRLNLGFAILRLDCGVKLKDPSVSSWYGPDKWFKKKNYGIQFGVGYPF